MAADPRQSPPPPDKREHSYPHSRGARRTDNSSLSYLNRLPVDELKIDRSFIADLATNARTHAIVASILALAQTLGLRSTAEGIEDLETIKLLSTMNCDAVQGYYIARPMPGPDFIDWANSRKPTQAAASANDA